MGVCRGQMGQWRKAHLPVKEGLGPANPGGQANQSGAQRSSMSSSVKGKPGEHVKMQEKEVSRRREKIRAGVQRQVLAWLSLNFLCGLGQVTVRSALQRAQLKAASSERPSLATLLKAVLSHSTPLTKRPSHWFVPLISVLCLPHWTRRPVSAFLQQPGQGSGFLLSGPPLRSSSPRDLCSHRSWQSIRGLGSSTCSSSRPQIPMLGTGVP